MILCSFVLLMLFSWAVNTARQVRIAFSTLAICTILREFPSVVLSVGYIPYHNSWSSPGHWYCYFPLQAAGHDQEPDGGMSQVDHPSIRTPFVHLHWTLSHLSMAAEIDSP